MALTQTQRRKVARRTTASSKARLRKRYLAGGAKTPAKKKAKGPNPLYDPTQQLSGKTLRRAAEQLTNLEFGAQGRALGRSMTQATRQGTELAGRSRDYYSQLAAEQAQGVARQQALGAELQGRLKTSADQSQQALSAIDQEAAQRATQDSAVRGAGLSGGGQDRVAAEVAAARALAAQGAQSSQEQAALSSSNWGNLQNITSQATGLQGAETQTQFLNRLSGQQADIRGRQNDLSVQVANKRAANILQLRQQGFENLVTSEGLNIDLKKIRASERASQRSASLARSRIKSSERQNRARIRTQERGQDISAFTQRRGQDVTARERALDRTSREKIAAGRKSKVGKSETSDSRKARLEISNILSDIKIRQGFRGKPKEWVVKKLTGEGASGLGTEIAYQLHITGWLGPDLMRRARAAGIRIPRSWKHPGGPYGSGIAHNKV